MVEAKVAAKFWADQLRYGAKFQSSSPLQRLIAPGSTKDSDDIDAMCSLAASFAKKLTEDQIQEFEKLLAQIIQEKIIEPESMGWEKSKTVPGWGSATRTIGTDYAMCSELQAAYQAVGGSPNATAFSIKTMMWINPGSVTVRHGYGAPEVELMDSTHAPDSLPTT